MTGNIPIMSRGVVALAPAPRLLAAAETVLENSGRRLYWVDQIEYDRTAAAGRASVNDTAFVAAWAEGRAMTLEQAITYALSETDPQ